MAHPQQPGAQAFPQGQGNSPNRAGTAGVTCSDAEHELTRSFVNALKEKGIKLLALDFDNTFINTHTRGFWDKPVDELAKKVRPCMRDLLLLAARDKDLKVCIVTFFKDEQIIRELLQHVYNSDEWRSCLIQCSSPELLQGHGMDLCTLGKQPHLVAVLTAIYRQHHVAIRAQEVLLLDDCADNVRTAIKFGHWAMLVPSEMTYETFESFTRMLAIT